MPCTTVREDLQAFHDHELPLDAQIQIQGHLSECVSCRLEAAALGELRGALRTMASSMTSPSDEDCARVTAAVIDRIHVEREMSFSAQVRGLFDDMHLVWAGLGASVAMLFCVFASAGVLHAASDENPDSLAGIISTIANQGSNDNPVRLAGTMRAPRALLAAPMPLTDEDTALAFSAVVTREGRIQNIALLEQQVRAFPGRPDLVVAMLDAASRTRFAPAQAGGEPVAVNVVWLMTITTVRGLPDYDLYLVRPPRWTIPGNGPMPPPKRPRPAKAPAPSGDCLAA
ncbi:MAG: zf-HC2 domain-containing protein [Acidobacteriota bacterium]